MTHTEIRAAITALKGKVKDLERKGDRASLDLKAEIVDQINEYHAQLPEGRSMTLQNNGGGHSGYNAGFGSLGEQMVAVVQAGLPGGQISPRLYEINAAAGLNETTPSEGGFLVQQDFSNMLLERIIQTGMLQKLCWNLPVSANANGIKINGVDETSRASSRHGGIVGYWASEAEEKTKSKPKFRQIELNLKKLIGLCYASDEMLQDANLLNTLLPTLFGNEFGFLVDDAILNGTGAGQPMGILNSGSLVTVGKEAGQAAASIMSENVFKMYQRLLPGSEKTAVWLINKSALQQIFQLSLSVGTGGAPIFVAGGSIAGQPSDTLLGRPIQQIEQCAALGTVGDILLCDFANGYLFATKAGAGIQADMSIHVRFIYDESCFRFVLRCDGQPVLATALTPYKGGAGNTQSHFIALESRT